MAGPTVAQLAQQATARDAAQALKDEAQKKEIEKMMQFIEELKAQLVPSLSLPFSANFRSCASCGDRMRR